jgi:hypothetical protein
MSEALPASQSDDHGNKTGRNRNRKDGPAVYAGKDPRFLCDQFASLIIDRIQMPRERKALYHQFFDDLKEVLVEMFKDVHYWYILMPIKISNHGTIQKIYNQYRTKLAKKEMWIYPRMDQFESIAKKTFYVLHKRV